MYDQMKTGVYMPDEHFIKMWDQMKPGVYIHARGTFCQNVGLNENYVHCFQ